TGDHESANSQYRDQFSDNWKIAEAKRWAPVFTQLEILTTIIRDAKPDEIISSGTPDYKLTLREKSDLALCLAQFRKQFDELLDEVVTIGHHFNPYVLLKTFQIYGDRQKNNYGCYIEYFGDYDDA